MKKKILLVVTVIMTAVSLIACGDGSKKSKETDVDKSSDSTFSKTEENTLEEDTTKEVNNDISDITEEKLRSHPETDASFFETTPSRQSLHGVEWEIAITGYEGPDSIVVIPEEIDGKKVVAIEYLGTENITSLLIPVSVIRVCEDAFMSSYNLKLVVFEEGINSIGNGAFLSCKKLETVILPETLESIGATAFASTAINKIELPDKIKEIPQYAFDSLEELTITVGDNIESVNIFAFNESNNITIIVKEGTKSMEAIEKYNKEASPDDKETPLLNIQNK